MERNQVEQRFKWNTDDIFPSDEAWEKAYAEAEKEINFSQYAGKLGNRSDLLAFLKANDEFLKKVERVFLYASMKHDEDTRISKYTAYSSKCDALISKYSAELAFFEPELASQTEEYLNSLVADKDFSDYDYTLKTLIKRKPHVIPEAEERLVALAGETLGSFSDIFSMIDNADLPLPEIERKKCQAHARHLRRHPSFIRQGEEEGGI